jgi:hypothetical protein
MNVCDFGGVVFSTFYSQLCSYYKNLNKVSKYHTKLQTLGEPTPKWVLAKDEDIGYITRHRLGLGAID